MMHFALHGPMQESKYKYHKISGNFSQLLINFHQCANHNMPFVLGLQELNDILQLLNILISDCRIVLYLNHSKRVTDTLLTSSPLESTWGIQKTPGTATVTWQYHVTAQLRFH